MYVLLFFHLANKIWVIGMLCQCHWLGNLPSLINAHQAWIRSSEAFGHGHYRLQCFCTKSWVSNCPLDAWLIFVANDLVFKPFSKKHLFSSLIALKKNFLNFICLWLDPGAAPEQQCSPGFSPFPRTFPFYISKARRAAPHTQRHTATPTRIFKFSSKIHFTLNGNTFDLRLKIHFTLIELLLYFHKW